MVIGYVSNNYSSSGMVQVKRFGHDDGAENGSDNLKWVYVSQGGAQPSLKGIGQANYLQPGTRVSMIEYGGKEGSYVATGSFPRMGSGSGGQDGVATSFSQINTAQADYPIPVQNPGPNGQRAESKPPDGQYLKAAGGQPYDFPNQYPDSEYKTL